MLNRVRLAAAAAVMVALACASAARADCKLVEIAEFHADVSSVGVPLLDGAINGTPIKVLIDSGSALSLVMRNSAERLHLASDRLPGQHVYGLGGQTDAYVATIKQLRVDKFTTSNLDLRIAGDRDAKLPWDVILGDDFLSKTDVEFDLADGFIRLFQSPGCEPAQLVYWGQPYSQVNLLPTNELAPAIIAPAQLNGQKVMAILDTGSSESLVDTTLADSLGFSRNAPGAQPAGAIRGLGRALEESSAANFDSFALGDEKIAHPRLHITQLRSQMQADETGSRIQYRFESAPDILLGADFLRAHRVFVANRERVMVFSYSGGPVFLSAEDLALIEAEKAISLNPNDAEAHRRRGLARMRRGQLDPGLQDFNDAVRLAPGSVLARLDRGYAYEQKGDFESALSDMDAAVQLGPTDPDTYVSRAVVHNERREFALAVADSDEALRLKPDDAVALNERCWTRAEANMTLDAALADCNAALTLRPGDPYVLDSRAFVYFRLAQFDKARDDGDAALGIDPKLASSLYIRGLSKRRLGQTASSDADMAAAKVIDPKIADTYVRLGVSP